MKHAHTIFRLTLYLIEKPFANRADPDQAALELPDQGFIMFAYGKLLLYLRPKVTLHCYYIYLFWVLVSGILNVFNSY